MNRLFIFFLFFSILLSTNAQRLKVVSVKVCDDDATASLKENQKVDINGDISGIIKVSCCVDGMEFTGSYFLGQNKKEDGEYWVWLAKGASKLTVLTPGYLPLDISFREYGFRVESEKTYRIVLVEPPKDDGQEYEDTHNDGVFVNLDFTQAAKQYLEDAEKGVVSAQYNIAVAYYHGEGVKRDYAEAVKWYEKAAGQGYAPAQYNLGVCYLNGEGVDQDENKAVQLFRKAAEQGLSIAQHDLGMCYFNGYVVKQDNTEAFNWLQKSAAQGDMSGLAALGLCYYRGCGVEKNYAEAFRLFTEAANLGSVEALLNIGICYFQGNGVEKNEEECYKYWKKAADQGSVVASELLKNYFPSRN